MDKFRSQKNIFPIYLPILIFVVVWFFAMFIHFNATFTYYKLSNDTVFIYFVGIFSIITGFLLTHSILDFSDSPISLQSKKYFFSDTAKMAKAIIFISLLMIIGLYLVSQEMLSIIQGQYSDYLERPLDIRMAIVDIQNGDAANYNRFLFRIGSYFLVLGAPASIIGGALATMPGRYKVVSYLPILFGLLSSAVFVKRFTFIAVLGFWTISYVAVVYFHEKKQRRKLAVDLAKNIIIFMIIIIFFFYIVIVARLNFEENVMMKDIIYESTYLYFFGSISAFEKFTHMYNEGLTWGASSFRSLFRYMSVVGLVDKEAVMGVHSNYANISTGGARFLNTYTFVKAPYQDFGLIGVNLIGLLWGGLVRIITHLLYKKFTFTKLMLYSVFTFSLLMTFYEFYFESISGLIFYLIIMKLFDYYWINGKKSISV